MISVLFVCLGNICRSPSAEAVFRRLCEEAGVAEHVQIDSAGTGSWHVGEAPDRRAQAAARQRGIDMSELRARQAVVGDFSRFDYVLAMDRNNLEELRRLCPGDFRGHLGLFLDFAPEIGERDVPDPYYGGDDGFDRVLDMIEEAGSGLLAELRPRLGER